MLTRDSVTSKIKMTKQVMWKRQPILCVLLIVTVPCVLVGTSCAVEKEQGGGTSVNCSDRNLTFLPNVTGENVTELNVAFNRITKLPKNSLSYLTHLIRVNLAHNQLMEMDQNAFHGPWSLQSVDLSQNRLTALQDGTFRNLSSLRSLTLDNNQIEELGPQSLEGLTQVTQLDLAYNQLQVLDNNTFVHLHHLTWLSLAYNRLSRLAAGAFCGLSSLTFLDLSNNDLYTASALPPGVFQPLGKLEDLNIDHNSGYNGYPDGVYSDLVSLHRLTIDSFSDMYFGPDFSALRSIETLDLTHNCGANIISNNSLEGFKNSTLSELLFNGCNLHKIELCAFCDLPALRRLKFESGNTLPHKIIESFYGLQYQNMSEISLIRVGKSLSLNYVVTYRVARYLRNICVTTFKMVNNKVQRLTGNALTSYNSTFSRCIENFDMSNNCLVGDMSALLHLLITCPRLRTLQLQDQNTFSFSTAKCLVNQNYQCKENLVQKDNNNNPGTTENFTVPIPPKLAFVNLSSVFPHLSPSHLNISFTSANHLKTLDMSYLGMTPCTTTFFGLENLETFSLEGNICSSFSDTTFDWMPSLTTLRLSSIVLHQEFVTNRAKRVFQNLKKLQVLDLSLNNLVYISSDMLQAQADLTALDLRGNRLQSVSVGLEHHQKLRRLDLSYNMLTSLKPSERRAMDTLAERHEFRLNLQGNPLVCSCYNMDLVPWLLDTAVALDGTELPANYTCTSEQGEPTSTAQVMDQWLTHWRRCVGERMLSVALSAFFAQILGLIITLFMVRSWPQLYYAWRAIRNLHILKRLHFPKDAFLVYANVDDDVTLACVTWQRILEDRYGVRLLLRNRDDVCGYEAENIVQHIDNSWKVVLLVTQAFCREDWACGFATAQAQRSISASMPDRVIVVFLEDVPRERLQQMDSLEMLLRMVKQRNVFYIRPGTPANHRVWKVLADTILYEPRKG